MTLMEYHIETGNERRQEPYNGDTVGTWSGGYLSVLSEHLSVRIMNSVYPENKRNPVRHIPVALVCHRHLRNSPPSVCLIMQQAYFITPCFRRTKNIQTEQPPSSQQETETGYKPPLENKVDPFPLLPKGRAGLQDRETSE